MYGIKNLTTGTWVQVSMVGEFESYLCLDFNDSFPEIYEDDDIALDYMNTVDIFGAGLYVTNTVENGTIVVEALSNCHPTHSFEMLELYA